MEEWLTLKEIATELKYHIETIREWVREGQLTAYKMGKDYRVKRSDLDKFLAEKKNRQG